MERSDTTRRERKTRERQDIPVINRKKKRPAQQMENILAVFVIAVFLSLMVQSFFTALCSECGRDRNASQQK